MMTTSTSTKFLPTISIVIPVYNGQRTIRFCLDSIRACDYPRELLEVIVVDNNSKDETPELIKQEYPWVKLCFERHKQGPHQATNTGLRAATHEIIVFTDADCYVAPDWLRKLVAPFADPEVVGVGGKIDAYTPESPVEEFLRERFAGANCLRMAEGFPASLLTGNSAYRAEAIRQVGAFNDNLYTGAEVDLAWRVQWQTGQRAVYAPDAVVYHKFDSRLKRLFRHFHVYGYSEIILGTLYGKLPNYPRTPARQLRFMLGQVRALGTYAGSIGVRTLRSLIKRRDVREETRQPLMWLLAESGSLYGKLQGMWHTRFYTRSFWEWEHRVI